MSRLSAFAIALLGLLLVPAGALGIGSGSVIGTVTVPAGANVQEVEVCVVEQNPSETCTYPAADGTYLLSGLNLGPQRIEFLPSYQSHLSPQFYDHKASLAEAATISLTSTSPSAKDVNADLVLGGVIEGLVTAAVGGAALEGVEVCALAAGTRKVSGCAESDSSGKYAIQGIVTGSYKIGFWGQGPSAGYASQYYADKSSFAEATAVALPAGATKAGIDAQLVKGAQIEGTVTDAATASPLADIPVCVFGSTAVLPQRCTYTDPAGGYAMSGFAAGTYLIGFSLEFDELGGEGSAVPEDDGYRTQYYEDAASRTEASLLELAPSEVSSGVDAKLVSSHEIAPPPPRPFAGGGPVVIPPTEAPPPVKKRAKGCKHGFKRVKAKGKTRCVKQHHKKPRRNQEEK